MPNNYSLNPYQAEESNLDEMYKEALAKILRPKPGIEDIYGSGQWAYDKARGESDLAGIRQSRTDAGERWKTGLAQALRGQDPDLIAQAMHPATEAGAMATIAKKQSQKMTNDQMDRIYKMYGGGQSLPGATGDDRPPLAMIRAMIGSGDPGLKAQGDDLFKMHYTPHDPKQSVVVGGSGQATPFAGADAAFGKQQDMIGDNTTVSVPMGDGSMKLMLRKDAKAAGLLQSNGPALGSSGPPGPPVSGAPNMPVNGPISPTSGPPPGASAAPPGDPRMEMLQQEVQSFQQAQQAGDRQAMAIHGRNIQQLQEGIQQGLANTNPQARAEGGGPTNQPNQGQMPPPDRGQLNRPNAGMGVTPSPADTKNFEARVSKDLDALAKMQEGTQGVFTSSNVLDDMERLNKKGLYSGFQEYTHGVGNKIGMTLGQPASQVYDDSREFESRAKSLIAPLAQKLGYNPSNYDAQTALAQIANLSDSPRGRAQIIDSMRRAVAYEIGTRSVVQSLVEHSYSIPQAQQLAHEAYKEKLSKEAQTKNPTQADGKGASLPSAIAATSKGDPGLTPGGPAESELYARDMFKNLGNLALAPFRGSHYAAGKDSVANFIEGVQQKFGAGDPKAYEAERARQEQRMAQDPNYAQSRAMSDITLNPINMIPGAGILKSAGLAGLHGFTQPTGTEGGSADKAVNSALWSLPLSMAAKILPTTALSKSVNEEGFADKLLQRFPSLRIKPSQADPDSVAGMAGRWAGVDRAAAKDQMTQINKDLADKAGMTGKMHPDNFATNEIRLGEVYDEVLPKGKVIDVTPADAAALKEAIARSGKVEDLMGKSMSLARLYQALQPAKATPTIAATPAAAAATSGSAKVPALKAPPSEAEWAAKVAAHDESFKPQTKAQYTAAAEARVPVKPMPSRARTPAEEQSAQAAQNHLDAVRAEENARQQLEQDMIRGEFGYKGPVQRFKPTPEQNAKLDAAVAKLDTSFSKATREASAEAEAALKAERAAAPKVKPNLGPSDVPPHPVSKPKVATEEKLRKFTAADLHEAWKDVRKVADNPQAAAEVRTLITGMIEKHLSPESLAAFRKANNQYGITEDLKRLYEGGRGEGRGSSSNEISAHAFVVGAGGHPMSQETDAAAQAINKFNIGDATHRHLSPDTPKGAMKALAAATTGWAAHKVDSMSQLLGHSQSPADRKRIIELLRATMERGPGTAYSGGR